MVFLGMTLTFILAGVGGVFLHEGDQQKGIAFLIAAGLMVIMSALYYRKRSRSRRNKRSQETAKNGSYFDCWYVDCGGDDCEDISDLADCGGCDSTPGLPDCDTPDCDCGGCDL